MKSFIERARTGKLRFAAERALGQHIQKSAWYVSARTAASNYLKRRADVLSFSQAGEDRIISFIFDALAIEKPTYLDIGAHDPIFISNTYYFYRHGSRGVCVEPDPLLAKEFRRHRPNDVCLQVGVGVDAESAADFFLMSSKSLNTFSRETAEQLERQGAYRIEAVVKIPLVGVNEIISHNFQGAPDVISIDTEGLDLPILRTLDFSANRPKVICVETLSPLENGDFEKNLPLMAFIEQQGYFSFGDTFVNTIYVDRESWLHRPTLRRSD